MRRSKGILGIVIAALLFGGARTAFCEARGASEASGEHALFTEALRTHVRDGHVDYARLCSDDRLERYLEQLSSADPDRIANDKARLAFWINAYNAFTLKIICDNYPVKSINDLHFGGRIIGHVLKKTVWDRKFIAIGGRELSLNQIEHDIIRREFHDYRIHFALVCAARSCPPLRSEAYEATRLDEQLDDQARVFLGEPRKNHFDMEGKFAYLSKIFDWYKSDFGEDDEQVLLAIAPFLPDSAAAAIRVNPGQWDIRYTDYDWSLND